MPIYDKNATKQAKDYLDTIAKIKAEEENTAEGAKKAAAARATAYKKLNDETRKVVDNIRDIASAESDATKGANKLGKTFDILKGDSSKIADLLEDVPKVIQRASKAGKQDLAKSLGGIANISEKILETGGDYTELTDKQIKQIENQLAAAAKLLQTNEALTGLNEQQLEDLQTYIAKLGGVVKGFKDAKIQAEFLQKASKATGGSLDGFLQVLDDFKNKKLEAAFTAVFTAATAAIVKLLNESIKAQQRLGTGIRLSAALGEISFKNLGLSILGVRDNILEAQNAAQIVGGSLANAADEALAVNRASLAIETGIGADALAQLEESFVNIAGLSRQAAGEALNSVQSFAEANDVAPTAVLQDMASNAEALAKFSDGTAMGMARAAVQAQRLGLNLSTAAGIARGLLDIESSLTAEFEASVLLGKNFNFDRARTLALNNDLVGAVSEVTRQLGGQQEFANMNVLQREAVAGALGIGVDQLAQTMARSDRATLDTNTFQQKSLDGFVELAKNSLLTNGILDKIALLVGSIAGFLIGGKLLSVLRNRVGGGTGGSIARAMSRGFDKLKLSLTRGTGGVLSGTTMLGRSSISNPSQLMLGPGTALRTNALSKTSDALTTQTKSLKLNNQIIPKNTTAMTKLTNVLKFGKSNLKGGVGLGLGLTALDVAMAEDKSAALGSGIADLVIGGVLTGAAAYFGAPALLAMGVGMAGSMAIKNIAGMFGDGGPVQRSGSYLVGEYGPEIVELKRGSMVHSNEDIKGAMAEGAGSGLADIGPLIAEIRGLKEQMRMVVNNTGDTAKGVGNISIATS